MLEVKFLIFITIIATSCYYCLQPASALFLNGKI